MSSAPMDKASVAPVKLAANLLQESMAVALRLRLSAVAMESIVVQRGTLVV